MRNVTVEGVVPTPRSSVFNAFIRDLGPAAQARAAN